MEPHDGGEDDHSDVHEATVVLPNKAGLHARSAATLVKESARFRSRITLHAAGGSAVTRSLMELLRLGARQGDSIRIQVEGDDAEVALSAVRALVESGFGEE
jgi:phosphotransferase system HPr (HPr) family protein